jgi:hypothetical protein
MVASVVSQGFLLSWYQSTSIHGLLYTLNPHDLMTQNCSWWPPFYPDKSWQIPIEFRFLANWVCFLIFPIQTVLIWSKLGVSPIFRQTQMISNWWYIPWKLCHISIDSPLLPGRLLQLNRCWYARAASQAKRSIPPNSWAEKCREIAGSDL